MLLPEGLNSYTYVLNLLLLFLGATDFLKKLIFLKNIFKYFLFKNFLKNNISLGDTFYVANLGLFCLVSCFLFLFYYYYYYY